MSTTTCECDRQRLNPFGEPRRVSGRKKKMQLYEYVVGSSYDGRTLRATRHCYMVRPAVYWTEQTLGRRNKSESIAMYRDGRLGIHDQGLRTQNGSEPMCLILLDKNEVVAVLPASIEWARRRIERDAPE